MEVWLVRHGETEWSRDLKHTSRTDVGLTPHGERQAIALAAGALVDHAFERVLTSPSIRAMDTARHAGYGRAEVVEDLREFDYGEYEGLTTKEIRETRPSWDLWRDGCPGGETVADAGRRADAILEFIGEPDSDVLLFAHAHILRILAARYLGLPPEDGRLFGLDAGSLSILGHERERNVIRLWNLRP